MFLNLNFLRSIANQNLTNFKINFKQLNAKINNEFLKSSEKSINSEGIVSKNFSGSKNTINYEISDEFILFSSDETSINDQRIFLNGKINTSPFYYNIYVDLDSINVIKFIRNFYKMQNLLQNKILLNKNFNGKIIFDIHSLLGIKLFDSWASCIAFPLSCNKYAAFSILNDPAQTRAVYSPKECPAKNFESFKFKLKHSINTLNIETPIVIIAGCVFCVNFNSASGPFNTRFESLKPKVLSTVSKTFLTDSNRS